ncbi:MAG: DUF2007 domain-containing protein [Paludibacteraceae bacterium]|nr:DUF2007 domain-containing protein [Paludibacteraceae bacterium]
MSNDHIIVLRTFDTLAPAIVATDALRQNGIEAMTDYSNSVQLNLMFGSSTSSGIRLCVFEKDATRAAAILNEMQLK